MNKSESMKFYGYKKCSTSRKAEKYLESKGIAFDFIDITENPPSLPSLKKIRSQSGLEIKKLFNTSGQEYKKQGLSSKLPSMSDQQKIELLATNGRLMKRPMVTDGKKATVGFDESVFKSTWG